MAKLSKSNKYAILWLNSQGVTAEEIAKELKVSIKQVESATKNQSDVPKQNNETNTVQLANKTAKDFMIRHSQNNVNNVSIMTQQASMMADEARKSATNNTSTSPFYIKKP